MSPSDLHLSKGAIVSCFFPLAEAPDTPGPVARPALVVRVIYDRIDMTWKAVLAYGTSRRTRANMGFEIRVSREEGLKQAGLDRPTRFTLSRMRLIPIDPRFFSLDARGTPVLGHLDAGLVDRLDSVFESLCHVAEPLRHLPREDGISIPIQSAGQTNIPPRPPPDRTINGHNLDRYMRENMRGRANLGPSRPTNSRRA